MLIYYMMTLVPAERSTLGFCSEILIEGFLLGLQIAALPFREEVAP